MQNREKPVTLTDLSSRLGVDKSLVSRVLRNDPGVRVSDRKRTEILDLAAALGYRPNRIAQSLRNRTSGVLALIVPDVTNPFYAILFRAVEEVALANGYIVLLCNAGEGSERFDQMLDVVGEGYFDGWLIASSRQSDSYIERLRRLGAHFVLINRRSDIPGIDWIGPDDRQSGELAARHLLELGHRRIGYVTADLGIKSMQLRLDGFRDALEQFSCPLDERLIVEAERTELRPLLAGMLAGTVCPRPTAVFVSNSFAVEPVWAAVRDAGLNIPRDISLVTYNAVSDAVFSGIAVPVAEIGRLGTEMLIGKLSEKGTASVGENRLLRVAFVDRGTTAAPIKP